MVDYTEHFYPKISHSGTLERSTLKKDIGGRGHCAVYYISPQSFIIKFFLFVGLTTLGTFIDFILIGSLSDVYKRFNR